MKIEIEIPEPPIGYSVESYRHVSKDELFLAYTGWEKWTSSESSELCYIVATRKPPTGLEWLKSLPLPTVFEWQRSKPFFLRKSYKGEIMLSWHGGICLLEDTPNFLAFYEFSDETCQILWQPKVTNEPNPQK